MAIKCSSARVARATGVIALSVMLVFVASCSLRETEGLLYGDSYVKNKYGQEERDKELQRKAERLAEAKQYCDAFAYDPHLSPLKGLLEWTPTSTGLFNVMGNDRVPTETEKRAILKWAEFKMKCVQNAINLRTADSLRKPQIDDLMVFAAELHNGNITYVEFAKKRHEINSYYGQIRRAERQKLDAIAIQLLGTMTLQELNRPPRPRPTPIYTKQMQRIMLQHQEILRRPEIHTNCFSNYIGKGNFVSNCVSRPN